MSSALTIEWRCLASHGPQALGGFAILPDLACGAARPALAERQPQAALSAPGAPTNLTFLVTGSTVTLNWAIGPSERPPTSYVIEAGSAPGGSDLVTFDTGSAITSLVATAVPPGVYFVRVRAKNVAGLSAPSNEVVITVGGACVGPLVAPTSLKASVSGSTVTLTWNASSGATSYILEVGSSAGATDVLTSDVGSQASLTASAPLGHYYLRVRARNACGTSQPSNEVVVVQFVVTGAPDDPANGRLTSIGMFSFDSSLAPAGGGTLRNTVTGLDIPSLSFSWDGTTWTTRNADLYQASFAPGGTLLSWHVGGVPAGLNGIEPGPPAYAVVDDFWIISNEVSLVPEKRPFGKRFTYTVGGVVGLYEGSLDAW